VRQLPKRGLIGDQVLPPAPGETLTYHSDERFNPREQREPLAVVKALIERWTEAARTARVEVKLRADAPVEERARWLLEFAVLDLDSLSEGDRLNLLEALKNFITPPGVRGSMAVVMRSLLPEGKVRELQRWLRLGLAYLATQGGWSMKTRTTRTLVLSPNGLAEWAMPPGTVPSAEAFKVRTFQVLEAAGPRFSLCRECRRPFIARKGQEYCTVRCSQAVRTRTFRAKRAAPKKSAR